MTRLIALILPLMIVTPALAQDQGGGRPNWGGGSQTKADAEQRAAMAFGLLDANHDGIVTQAEVDAAAKASAGNPRMANRLTRMFAESDANHDGKLTADEAKARADQAFDAADTNHDGVISPEERQAARQRMMSQAPQQ